MEKPTCEELFEHDYHDPALFARVNRETDDSWRHGCYVTEVYRRLADDTYWLASYRLSSDGETNELREGLADVRQVRPKQVTTTIYELV